MTHINHRRPAPTTQRAGTPRRSEQPQRRHGEAMCTVTAGRSRPAGANLQPNDTRKRGREGDRRAAADVRRGTQRQ
eukprot:5593926-Pyramimonas_sp.AAC.1